MAKKKEKTQWAETVETGLVFIAFLITFGIGWTMGHDVDNEVWLDLECNGVSFEYYVTSKEIKVDC